MSIRELEHEYNALIRELAQCAGMPPTQCVEHLKKILERCRALNSEVKRRMSILDDGGAKILPFKEGA